MKDLDKKYKGVETMAAVGILVKCIKKQQNMILGAHYDPTWELFEGTFGWFQMQKQMSPELQDFYKEIWNKVYNKEL